MRRPLHLIAVRLVLGVGRSRMRQRRQLIERSSSGSGARRDRTPAAKKIKVGLVTDIGGLNDRSFNQLANQGLEQAQVRPRRRRAACSTSKSNADYVPNLSTLAQQKYDLVIGVGFLMADAMDTVATKFPNTKFAIIDVDAVGA